MKLSSFTCAISVLCIGLLNIAPANASLIQLEVNKITLTAAQATDLAGFDDIEVSGPANKVNPPSQGGFVDSQLANDFLVGQGTTNTFSDPANQRTGRRFLFGSQNPAAGDMLQFTFRKVKSGYKDIRIEFTRGGGVGPDGLIVPGTKIDSVKIIKAHAPKHEVKKSNSFDFAFGLHNDTFSNPVLGGPRPVEFSNLRMFTDIDFGQTTFEEATQLTSDFVDTTSFVFDTLGNLLVSPPGLEIDVPALLVGIPEFDPISEILTLSTEDLLLPSFPLADILGVTMISGRVTVNDSAGEFPVVDFVAFHQVSVVVSEPTTALLTLGLLGAGYARRWRVH